MNLTKAETYYDKWMAVNVHFPEDTIELYRQIQADALRFSVARIKSDPDIAFALVSIEDLANQLHPIKEQALWTCPNNHGSWSDPDFLGQPYCCPECGTALQSTLKHA